MDMNARGQLKHGLSGFTVVRNALSLDYCIELCIQSLLPVCEEVLVCDSDSTDGTREMLEAWAKKEPKIRIINYEWKERPQGDKTWITGWMNFARRYLHFASQIYLDADEVLGKWGYEVIRNASGTHNCFWFHRLNFWRDAQHLVPKGHCCADEVARFGPTDMWMPADEIHAPGEHPGPEPVMRLRAIRHPALKIFHYGFLRKRESFFAKCKVVLPNLLGTYDPRLVKAEAGPGPWEDYTPFIDQGSGREIPLPPYTGPHPQIAHQWLRERGHSPVAL